MNRQQKEILQSQLNSEKQTIRELKEVYMQALKDVSEKINELSARADMEPQNLQSIIYQKQYQEAIKAQIEGVLAQMDSDAYATIAEYLANCYQEGYVGVMYDIAAQGIPLIIPIDPEDVQRAIQLDSKLSKGLYSRLGEDVKELKKAVRTEVSRGIISGLSWHQIASKLAGNFKNTPFNKAYNNSIRIARTEGHRIQNQSALDAQKKAKSKGANVVKQWDSTLDGKTRDTHRLLDGQIREVDEPFEVEGKKADAPGMFGDPAEDCNCRCCLLQRARWALDESELEVLREKAAYHGLLVDDSKKYGHEKAKDFSDFKEKYLKASSKDAIINIDELTPCLRRMSDGKIVDTTVETIIPKKGEFKDWEFNWNTPIKNEYTIHAIKANGDDRIQGMVAFKPDPQNLAVIIDIVEAAPFNNPHNKAFVKKEYSGVGGHLFAEAIKQSFEYGFDGFVYFKAKTDLVEHYQNELGAVLINPKERIMAIDERSAKKLYDRYYKGK